MESGMAIRIGFVVLDGREHTKRRNLWIPSRICGPDAIMLLLRKHIRKAHPSILSKPQSPRAQNDRKDRGKISSVYTKSGFVMIFASQSRVFHGQRHFWCSVQLIHYNTSSCPMAGQAMYSAWCCTGPPPQAKYSAWRCRGPPPQAMYSAWRCTYTTSLSESISRKN